MKIYLYNFIILCLLTLLLLQPLYASIDNSILESNKNTYNNKANVIWNIVLVGMVIIFISLSIVAIIISLLKYFDKHKKEKLKDVKNNDNTKNRLNVIKSFPLKNPKPLNHNIQLAIITTIFLHEHEVDKLSKMLLTMRRTKISNWKQSGSLFMSNYSYNKKQL